MTDPAASDLCPHCGEALEYDEVDIGVGVQRGNPGCPSCLWTPSEQKRLDEAFRSLTEYEGDPEVGDEID